MYVVKQKLDVSSISTSNPILASVISNIIVQQVMSTSTFSLRAIVSAVCFTRNLKTFLYNVAFMSWHFVTLFLYFKLLGVLVVPLGHLHDPNLDLINWLVDFSVVLYDCEIIINSNWWIAFPHLLVKSTKKAWPVFDATVSGIFQHIDWPPPWSLP